MKHADARVLARNGLVHSPAHPAATALLVVDGTVAWVGDEADAERHVDGAAVVDLAGRLVTPGFVDAHVHLAKTGIALQTLDLSATVSVDDCLGSLQRYARTAAEGVLEAHGWDESRWPEARPFSGTELDRAVGDRPAYVGRVDSHSAVVSTALVDRAPAIKTADGWRGDGVVERDAHHLARAATDALRSRADREQALRVALRAAAAAGLTSVHEANAPHISPYDDAALVRSLGRAEVVPEVTAYWGAVRGGEHADDAELAGFAGDLCVDGALGSRTAALRAPYTDAETAGHLYLDAAEIADHIVWCTARGRQAGFHAIGDRALDAVADGLRQAAARVGAERVVAARHRLEHVEMPSPDVVATLARFGVVASVQPAFDAAWGGPGQLYEQRLGAARAHPMNPFATMRRAGVRLAFGSDSPVTPLDPWGAVQAATRHANPAERLPVAVAFDAHTRGGHQARHADSGGTLEPGAAASYAVWDVRRDAGGAAPNAADLVAQIGTGEQRPTCVRTVVAGAVAFDREEPS